MIYQFRLLVFATIKGHTFRLKARRFVIRNMRSSYMYLYPPVPCRHIEITQITSYSCDLRYLVSLSVQYYIAGLRYTDIVLRRSYVTQKSM